MSSQSQTPRRVGSRSTPGVFRIWLAALCALALIGCGAAGDRQHAAALQRWQAQPVAHYRLNTREVVSGHACAQVVEVRDEQLVKIILDSCQQPSLWTVSWLFRYAEKARQVTERCALAVPGAGCVCRDDVDVRVEYDPALGFPRSITIRQTWSAAWQRLGYWVYLARNLSPPNCTPPFTDPGRVVLVRELRPLP